MPRETTPATTRLFVAAGAIAANAPDLDLLYVGITPFPLGYLLHHRGHTHTVIGLIAQAMPIALVCQLVLRFVEGPGLWRARLWGLVAIALGSHVALDACNSYGVHPFHPIDPRWYFGDTLFIFEPWLWLVLSVTVAMSVQRRVMRALLIAPMATLLAALTFVSMISVLTFAGLFLSGVAFAWLMRSWGPRARATAGLAALLLIVVALSSFSAKARAATRELIAADARTSGVSRQSRELVDIVLTPDPAAPLCWTAITIERDDRTGTFVTRRGTLSLWPAWQSPESCASHRLTGLRASRRVGDGRLVWSEEIEQPLAELRGLAASDCRVAAWLQFGRAPVLRPDRIFDLRFESPRGNFSAMTLSPAAASPCPANLTSWAKPRADLLGD